VLKEIRWLDVDGKLNIALLETTDCWDRVILVFVKYPYAVNFVTV